MVDKDHCNNLTICYNPFPLSVNMLQEMSRRTFFEKTGTLGLGLVLSRYLSPEQSTGSLRIESSEYIPMTDREKQIIDRPYLVVPSGQLHSEFIVSQVWNDLMAAHIGYSKNGETFHRYSSYYNHMSYPRAAADGAHLVIASEVAGRRELPQLESLRTQETPPPLFFNIFNANIITSQSSKELTYNSNSFNLPSIPNIGLFSVSLRPSSDVSELPLREEPQNFWFWDPRITLGQENLVVATQIISQENPYDGVQGLGIWRLNPNSLELQSEPQFIPHQLNEYDLLFYNNTISALGLSQDYSQLTLVRDLSQNETIFSLNDGWSVMHPTFIVKGDSLHFVGELHSDSGMPKVQAIFGTYNLDSHTLIDINVVSGGVYNLLSPSITVSQNGNYLLSVNPWYSGYAQASTVLSVHPQTLSFDQVSFNQPRGYARISTPYIINRQEYVKVIGSALEHNWQGAEEVTLAI